MSVLATALFGSRARNDGALSSDTDILLVTDEKSIRKSAEDSLSLSFYPGDVLLQMAANGNLFVGHIVLEAKVLSDARGFFDRLRSEWRIKSDYSREVKNASALGAFLLSPHASCLEPAVWNKRTAWCVRTILVARTFEKGSPAFSTAALTQFAGTSLVSDLIEIKSSTVCHAGVAEGLNAFLRHWGEPNLLRAQDSDLEAYRLEFLSSGNQIGLQTLKQWLASGEVAYLE